MADRRFVARRERCTARELDAHDDEVMAGAAKAGDFLVSQQGHKPAVWTREKFEAHFEADFEDDE